MNEEIESPYLNEEINLSRITPFHIYLEMMKVTAWKRFAHHPTCSQYKEHYYNVGKLKLCVGCTSLYSTIFLSLIIYMTIPSIFKNIPLILGILFLYGCFSALIHFVVRPSTKLMKTLFRSSAGIGLGAYLALIFYLRLWWLQIILFLFLFVGFAVYGLIRGKGHNKRKCNTCPLHTAEIPCCPDKNTSIKIMKLNKLVSSQLKKRISSE
jgi:hypothetical protein